MRSIKKWKTFLSIFIATVFGAILFSVVRGRPVTWYFVGFVAIFMVVVMSVALFVDYFFGERIRSNPQTVMIVLAVCWLLFLVSAVGNFIKNYTAGRGIDWLSVFAGTAAIIASIGWLRHMRLQKKR